MILFFAACALPAVAGGARIEGLLLGVDGRAATGYTLHLIDGEGRGVGEARTSDEGVYSFRELPPGSYSLAVEDAAGRLAVVDAPALRLGARSLARRDVRLMETDPASHQAVLQGNPSVGLWWAGMSPWARAWTVVGIVVFVALTYAALDDDDDSSRDDEDDASPIGTMSSQLPL
jgi:hypothetical protein